MLPAGEELQRLVPGEIELTAVGERGELGDLLRIEAVPLRDGELFKKAGGDKKRGTILEHYAVPADGSSD
jgi:hypothetical protein